MGRILIFSPSKRGVVLYVSELRLRLLPWSHPLSRVWVDADTGRTKRSVIIRSPWGHAQAPLWSGYPVQGHIYDTILMLTGTVIPML